MASTPVTTTDIASVDATTINPLTVTTLASEIKVQNIQTVHLLAVVFLVGVPIATLTICVAIVIIRHRREQKVTSDVDNEMNTFADSGTKEPDDDSDFQHPAPCHPNLKKFKGLAIAGPFGQPSEVDEAEEREVATPSFISTTMVEDSNISRPQRYTYIP